ncbi:hypothetical protein AJ80_04988 [Polytolypa hystricis UAMH7299]|uniref:Uncharacterized protein n=1 Tax=Polytolypa hystricis (strain UAMH7299) TaxID=1447883 RepID=A0A2B7Y6U1_POLH7|nr:hypothetical protein AJ80_04988 [Polytolypa hystricis UAMH7299]
MPSLSSLGDGRRCRLVLLAVVAQVFVRSQSVAGYRVTLAEHVVTANGVTMPAAALYEMSPEDVGLPNQFNNDDDQDAVMVNEPSLAKRRLRPHLAITSASLVWCVRYVPYVPNTLFICSTYYDGVTVEGLKKGSPLMNGYRIFVSSQSG